MISQENTEEIAALRRRVVLYALILGMLVGYQLRRHGLPHPSLLSRVQHRSAVTSYRIRALLELRELDRAEDAAAALARHGCSSRRFDPIADSLARSAARAGVDAMLVAAVIAAESACSPRLVSPKGAVGLMLLMPDTAEMLAVGDSFDQDQNMAGGTRYLRDLLKYFKGDVELALAGYNAGPGAVMRHRGIPPYRETEEYVRRVMRVYGALTRKTSWLIAGALALAAAFLVVLRMGRGTKARRVDSAPPPAL